MQTTRNKLLSRLSPQDLTLLEPNLEPVQLQLRECLEFANRRVEHVYFLEHGLASIVARLPRGRDIEVGMVGREGVTGACVILGADQTPNTTFMQVAGSGFRVRSEILRGALAQSETLRATTLRYVQALACQMASTALANGRSRLEERLSRWLLMVHDRGDSDTLSLTHEFLATMLGVRRPGVTVALHILEGKGLIRSVRGHVVIRDRDGLIALSDGSYGTAEAEYRRLLG